MSKVDTEIVRKALETTEGIAPKQRAEVLAKLKETLEQEALEKEQKPPAVKKEFVILVSDPKGALANTYPDGVSGWVLQIPEGEAPEDAIHCLHAACYDHNAGHGRKMPVETIGEACETLSVKATKEHNVWVKTKEAVLVLTTDNKIPKSLPDAVKDFGKVFKSPDATISISNSTSYAHKP